MGLILVILAVVMVIARGGNVDWFTKDNTGCDPSYPTVCIPPKPPDLDCGEISHRNFEVIGADPHGFDGDNDGRGCER